MRKLFVVFFICGVLFFLAEPSSARTLVVPSEYPTILGAINMANQGDTVYLATGTYYDHVIINKRICLTGAPFDPADGFPVVDGSGTGDVIRVETNGVVIRRLTIKHAGSNEPYGGDWDAGIELADVDSCRIYQTYVQNNPAAGLFLWEGAHNIIENCAFIENGNGIHFAQPTPLSTTKDAHSPKSAGGADNNFQNVIRNCFFVTNSDIGIRFAHNLDAYHMQNEVYHNIFYGERIGLGMIMSEDNLIHSNQFMYSYEYAIALSECMCGGDGNWFYGNVFVDNNGGGIQAVTETPGTDYWDNGVSGNFWSDYTGEDMNHDGFGDEPYIPDNMIANGQQDNYPMMGYLDIDGDGLADVVDNCPGVSNPGQGDADLDGFGNVCEYVCGDADGNGVCNISDAVRLVNWIFKGYLPSNPLQSGDADCNEENNISDAVRIIDWVFKGGTAPCCP